MNIVVDASVAAKWLLAEADSDKATALFQAWNGEPHSAACPESSSGSVQCSVEESDARPPTRGGEREGCNRANGLASLHPIGELVDAAFDLSLRFRHSVYDGLYLAWRVRLADL